MTDDRRFRVEGFPELPQPGLHWTVEKTEFSIDNGPEDFEYEVWSVNLVEPGEDTLSQNVYDLSDVTLVDAAKSILDRHVSRNRARALEEGPVGLY